MAGIKELIQRLSQTDQFFEELTHLIAPPLSSDGLNRAKSPPNVYLEKGATVYPGPLDGLSLSNSEGTFQSVFSEVPLFHDGRWKVLHIVRSLVDDGLPS